MNTNVHDIKYSNNFINNNFFYIHRNLKIDIEKTNIKEDDIDDVFTNLNYLEPAIFNEKIAVHCGFIPFLYQQEEDVDLYTLYLLSPGGVGFNFSYMCDAYEALVNKTIYKRSTFFTNKIEWPLYLYNEIEQKINEGTIKVYE